MQNLEPPFQDRFHFIALVLGPDWLHGRIFYAGGILIIDKCSTADMSDVNWYNFRLEESNLEKTFERIKS